MKRTLIILILTLIVSALQAQMVVINEVLAGPSPNPFDYSMQNTANANSLYSIDPNMQPPYNREYIELYNTSPCDTADLSCYTLGSNANSPTSGPNWGAFTFPQGTKIPPLGFLIIGGNDAQVMINDFNITWYRQNTFNVQYLCGDNTRWFLRDMWGWVALYDPQGNPVNAVYWNDIPGNSASLFSEAEYQNPIVNTMACGGTKTLPAASAIPGIEYVGNIISGSFTSFQRVQDGSMTWHPTPVTPTPRAPNGTPIQHPYVSHSVLPEHCGNGDGEIILQITPGGTGPYTVFWNGSTVPGGLTLSNLQAGTYTLFVQDAYDCLNVYDTIIVPHEAGPDISFSSINDERCSASDGSISATIAGGTTPYSITWNTNPASSATTVNNLSEGTYKIVVTDALGCNSEDSVFISNHKEPTLAVVLISPDSCEYGIGSAEAIVTGDYHPYNYLWNSTPPQNTPVAANLPGGNYIITVHDGICTVSANVVVPLIPAPLPQFVANPEIVYLEDGIVNFTDLTQGSIIEWLWDFDDGNSSVLQHPVHRFTDYGKHNVVLKVTDNNGCVGITSRDIFVKDRTAIYFPNAFTPNGDGLNDIFKPVGIYITNYHLQIFDRAGRAVFYSGDPEHGWDGYIEGIPAQDGVYVWICTFTHDYGDNLVKDLKLKGTVTLMR